MKVTVKSTFDNRIITFIIRDPGAQKQCSVAGVYL